MNQTSIDLSLSIVKTMLWASTIAVVLGVAYKFQKNIAQESENKIDLKDSEIEKTIDSEPLSDLVNSNNNNKDGKG